MIYTIIFNSQIKSETLATSRYRNILQYKGTVIVSAHSTNICSINKSFTEKNIKEEALDNLPRSHEK